MTNTAPHAVLDATSTLETVNGTVIMIDAVGKIVANDQDHEDEVQIEGNPAIGEGKS